MRKLLIRVAVALLCLVLAAAVGGYLWLRGQGLPARGGDHPLPGLRSEVTVRWDRWGVPHLAGSSEEDLFAALGYLHANDRLTQMELGRRAAFGRLSEILGEATFEVDVHFRQLRLRQTAERLLAAASPQSRRWLEAYAAGVNAWLAERGSDLPPEMRVLGMAPEPWSELDSIAFALLMAVDLSFWNDRPEEERFRWLRAFGAEGVRDLLGEPDVHIPETVLALATGTALQDPAAEEAGAGGEPEVPATPSPGSNNWALGGSRTASGRPLLANDPHLAFHLPGVWYQVQMRAPGFAAAGMTLPGAPGVVIGRGPHLAWAFTNVMLDDHDIFFEQLDESGERVRRGDAWLPIEQVEETIAVRGGEERSITLRSTDLGPLLAADPVRGLPPRSLLWTGHFDGDLMAAFRGLSQAATAEEAQTAIAGYVCPAQNLVVALEDGTLLYTVLGRVPARRAGDGRLPAPGWDAAYGWDGLRPRDTNPTVAAPPEDLLVTANHDIRPPGYPLPLVAEFYPGHRAGRIRELLGQRRDWDRTAFAGVQNDVVSLFARDIVAALGDGWDGDAGRAQQALAAWDGAMTERGPAALFAVVERRLLTDLFGDEAASAGVEPFATRGRVLRLLRGEMAERWFDDLTTPESESRHETLGHILAAAWREGGERWGEDVAGWDYGGLHRLTLRHRLDAVPGLGAWLRRGPFEMPGSATTVASFSAFWRDGRQEVAWGPSMRWVVDWSAPEVAYASLPGGQSGHPADPHYDDQVGLYLAGELHPAPWSESEIEAAAVANMRLLPIQIDGVGRRAR